MKHTESISQAFGPAAAAYLESPVHAQGAELELLGQMVAATPQACVLDLGCGAGHMSFAVAPYAAEVVAYDLTEEMLAVVKTETAQRGHGHLRTVRGSAESLPFADASFDWVVSRYSTHHWRNIVPALKEAKRVLKSGGQVCFIDIAGGREPLFDTYLQAVEVLRDPSHVRDYTEREWLAFLRDTGFEASVKRRWRVPIEFASWVARIGTPVERAEAIKSLWNAAPVEVREVFHVQKDFSFELDAVMVAGLA